MSTEVQGEAYAEDAILTELLGPSPKVKLLTAFLSEPNPQFDYTVSELSRLSGVSRKTVYRHLPDLEELEIIRKTRTSGASERYKINTDHPAADHLAKLEWDLAKHQHQDTGSE